MSKMLLPYAIMQKVNCFCDEERKNPFIHVSTVSNNLNFALQGFLLLIKSKSLRNMEVNTVHNKNDAICNLTPSGLQLLLFS